MGRNKKRTYEEMYGKAKAKKVKKIRSLKMAEYNRKNKEKSWEKLYGEKKANLKKHKFSKNSINMWNKKGYREKTCRKMRGISKTLTNKQRNYLRKNGKKLSLLKKGKTYEEMYGIEKAREMKNNLSKKIKGKKKSLDFCLKQRGKKQSESAKKLISKANRKSWNEHYGIYKANLMRQKLSKERLGKKNHFYIHGKSKLPYPQQWNIPLRRKIRIRDKKCVICKISNKKCKKIFNEWLTVHHIDGNKNNLDEFNLICLCKYHHCKIMKYYLDLQDYFHSKIIVEN
jgi:hypothetical protein